MKPRFQADNDLRNSIRNGVLRREQAIDFQSARAAQLDGVPDSAVLEIAATADRILVTHDENSMPRHFAAFLADGNHSPGVFVVPQGVPTGIVIENILLLWLASESSEWRDQIAWLPL